MSTVAFPLPHFSSFRLGPGLAAFAQAPEATGAGWLDSFVPFSLLHAVSVLVFGASMVTACALGKRWRGTERERRFRLTWGWTVLIYQTFYTVWYAMPHRWDWKDSLPLQLCDLAAFLAGLAMVAPWRPLRTLLYFWGIGLSTQAFFTPTLQYGVGHTKFWLFWLGHTAIVGSAVYDVVVRGYRPRLRDLGLAVALTYTMAMSIFFFNILLSELVNEPINYWYIGPSKPSNPTPLDLLGPWPLRVVWMALIVLVDFLLLWALWPLARRLLGGRDPVAAAEAELR